MKRPRDLVLTTSQAAGPLDESSRRKATTVIRAIDDVKRDAQKVKQVSRQEIEEVADRYSRAPSTFLAAVVGGTVGAAGGVAVGTLGGAVVLISGPLGLALGAALGVLAFRGRNYWRLETSTQKAKAAMTVIRGEIDALPPDAPPEVRQNLYRRYDEVAEEYSRVARQSIDDERPRRREIQGTS